MPSIEQLEKLLEAEPDDTFLLYGLAQEHAKAGAVDAAIGYYDRVLAIDPSYCYAYFHRARALEEAGRVPEAVETLSRGLDAARQAGDQQAIGEISGYLESLT